jgi:hypothetical protein
MKDLPEVYASKVCRECKLTKEYSEFRLADICKQCNFDKYNKIVRDRKRKRKFELLDGDACETCGIDIPELLDFAHRDRNTKTNDLARMLSLKEETSQAEREKCRILCATCHSIETHEENNSYKYIFVKTGVKPSRGVPQWRQKLLILEYQLKRECVKCGEKDIRVLEFDHINPSTKIMSITNMVTKGKSTEDIEKEIAKTRILCRLCHRLHTIKQKFHTREVVGDERRSQGKYVYANIKK